VQGIKLAQCYRFFASFAAAVFSGEELDSRFFFRSRDNRSIKLRVPIVGDSVLGGNVVAVLCASGDETKGS